MTKPVALITGGGRRIGAEVARQLHSEGFNILIHFLKSKDEAAELASVLNYTRAGSAKTMRANLSNEDEITQLSQAAIKAWGTLDVLINHSNPYSANLNKVTEKQWEDLITNKTKAPFFLSRSLAPELKKQQGCIVNIHAERPPSNDSFYTIAKTGNELLTKCLARELAPEVRVNGISSDIITLPESTQRIAKMVLFFVQNALHTTGQVLAVDGDRDRDRDRKPAL